MPIIVKANCDDNATCDTAVGKDETGDKCGGHGEKERVDTGASEDVAEEERKLIRPSQERKQSRNETTLGTADRKSIPRVVIAPLNLEGTRSSLLPVDSSAYGRRTQSADINQNAKCNNVFFDHEAASDSGLDRSSEHVRDSSLGDKMRLNFSVESGYSNASRSHTATRSRRCRARSSVKPPDGGWGWVVVFASFMISMIADGVSFSFGIFFVDLSNYFGAAKSKTAFVGSLFLSMPLLIGPVASAMTDRYGCRRVTIVSGLLSATGFLIGFFAQKLEHLFIAFSISGAGLALSYVTSIVIVAYYFEKRRSLATGLAVCGTGFGTFVFAPLTIFLMEKYSWRGTLLIMAGFFLNIIVFGSLMRDLPETDDDSISDRSCDYESDNYANEAFEHNNMHHPTHLHHHQHHVHAQQVHDHNCNHDNKDDCGPFSTKVNSKPRLFSSMVHIPTYITHRNSVSETQDLGNVINEMTQNKDGYLSKLLKSYPNVLSTFVLGAPTDIRRGWTLNNANNLCQSETGSPLKPIPESRTLITSSIPEVDPKSPETNSLTVRQKHRPSNVMSSLSPEAGHHLRNLKLQRGSISYRSAMLNIKRYRLRASSCPDIYRNSMLTISEGNSPARNCFEDVKETFSDLIDVSIFKSVKYTIFCLSNFLLYMCIDIPYVYMPDHAIHTGSADRESSSFLISVIGIVNTIGIVLVGYIGDKPWIEPATLYSFFISLSGVSIGLIPFIHDYAGLATLAACFGFTISANYALVSVILVDLISLDKFTNGYGLLLLVQGVASLIGPPFAGWLYDITGSYDVTFYVTGLCCFVSGAIVIPVASTPAQRAGQRAAQEDGRRLRDEALRGEGEEDGDEGMEGGRETRRDDDMVSKCSLNQLPTNLSAASQHTNAIAGAKQCIEKRDDLVKEN
ncbi:Monocarboxylate transporter 12 [Halotydeus destructor]|nr:Monocarboxylate transporter 12 [Halotydeus destructor]